MKQAGFGQEWEGARPLIQRFTRRWVVILTLLALLALAVTGFLGYKDESLAGLDKVFLRSWVLFIWFCLLIVTLQRAMIWKPAQKQQQRLALIATGVSVVLA